MSVATKIDPSSLRGRWDTLSGRCSEVLSRAEEAAKVTIPAAFVRDGHSESTKLTKPFQSLGARAVNKLAAKLVMTLLPPNNSFFRFGLTEDTKAALSAQGMDSKAISETEEQLANAERRVMKAIESSSARPVVAQLSVALLITGNYLLHISKNGAYRGFGLRAFRVNRDPEGEVLELVIREEVAPETLSDALKAHCGIEPGNVADEKAIELFTTMRREGDRYKVWQEVNGVRVPLSDGDYPIDEPPFIVVRWSAIHGEDYGRGMVDQYIGDFNALNDLCRDLLNASGNAAKVVFLTKANSQVTPTILAKAKNGDVLTGTKDDVSTVTLDKFADFQVVLKQIQLITDALSAAFLLNSSVQRNAERVTAEEIRFMAQELEDALGGVYSVLAAELQRPMAKRQIAVLTKQGKMPSLPKEHVDLTITTGLEALGRGHDLNRLVTYARTVSEVLGPDAAKTYLNPTWVLNQIAASMGIDPKQANRTEAEINTMQQQAQAAQLMEKIGPNVAGEITKGAFSK